MNRITHLEKKYVLEAALEYLKNPTSDNEGHMLTTIKDNPRFNEALLGNSTTGYLVDQATALIDGIREKPPLRIK